MLDRLAASVSTYDLVSAATACEELIAHIRSDSDPIGEIEIKRAMGLLRRMKAFDLMSDLGDAAITGGQNSPTVHRQ
jgi:hypothetical protein